jgi:hypothetical protein
MGGEMSKKTSIGLHATWAQSGQRCERIRVPAHCDDAGTQRKCNVHSGPAEDAGGGGDHDGLARAYANIV